MAELSLSVILEQMDGQLDGLEDIFVDYQNKLEQARREAAANMEQDKDKFLKYQATVRRRRALKKQYEDNIAKFARELVVKLRGSSEDDGDQEEREMYQTLVT